jgi:hypothetical protein
MVVRVFVVVGTPMIVVNVVVVDDTVVTVVAVVVVMVVTSGFAVVVFCPQHLTRHTSAMYKDGTAVIAAQAFVVSAQNSGSSLNCTFKKFEQIRFT